jgi:hypothetical protein
MWEEVDSLHPRCNALVYKDGYEDGGSAVYRMLRSQPEPLEKRMNGKRHENGLRGHCARGSLCFVAVCAAVLQPVVATCVLVEGAAVLAMELQRGET